MSATVYARCGRGINCPFTMPPRFRKKKLVQKLFRIPYMTEGLRAREGKATDVRLTGATMSSVTTFEKISSE